jgi:hypothetical protein
MKDIIITVMTKGKTEPETIVTIPFNNFGIVELLIPKEALTILQEDGLNLTEIIKAAKKEDLTGDLVEIQKPDKRISLAIQKEGLRKKDK